MNRPTFVSTRDGQSKQSWNKVFFNNYCYYYKILIKKLFSRFGLWWYLVYDTPHEHPRISVDELEYIAKNTPPPIAHEKKNPVPWWSILTSGPLWVTIAAQWGITWGFFTLLAQAPSYFNYIHGWSLNMVNLTCL